LEHDEDFEFYADEFTIMEEDNEPVKVPRTHAEMIRQWLDVASLEVEWRMFENDHWTEAKNPTWAPYWQYHFKPKTIPAWKVLYEYGSGDIDLTAGHYKTEEEFNKRMGHNAKFIKFVLETEKQIPA
jgi:hypothetical protein